MMACWLRSTATWLRRRGTQWGAVGRDAQPTTGVIDSQSVKTSQKTSLLGYDAGKKIKGRKRHIIIDTCGTLIAGEVHTANIQDRDGALRVFAKLRREAPKLRHVFADGGYAGPKLCGALLGRWRLQIVKRSDTAKGFKVLPCRWVVERTFAWPGRCRRLARDREKTIASAGASVLIAHIRRMTRLLARACNRLHHFESDSEGGGQGSTPVTARFRCAVA